MPDDGHHTAQLHHLAEGGGHNGGIVQLEGHRPRDVERWRQLPQDHVAQNLGAVVVVLVGVLHEAEAVHVAHVGLAIGPEQVESADGLLERQTHLPGDELLGVVEDDRVADLLALAVALHLSVEGRALPGLRVGIVRADGVHLDVRA